MESKATSPLSRSFGPEPVTHNLAVLRVQFDADKLTTLQLCRK